MSRLTSTGPLPLRSVYKIKHLYLKLSALVHDLFWFFQVNAGTNVVLQNNIVAGYERVAYHIDGEPCPGNGNVSFK